MTLENRQGSRTRDREPTRQLVAEADAGSMRETEVAQRDGVKHVHFDWNASTAGLRHKRFVQTETSVLPVIRQQAEPVRWRFRASRDSAQTQGGWWSEADSPVTVWNVQTTGSRSTPQLGTRPNASMRIVRSFSGFLLPVAVCRVWPGGQADSLSARRARGGLQPRSRTPGQCGLPACGR